MFRLFPCPGYCKYCCNEHWGACIILSYILLDSKKEQYLEKMAGGALIMRLAAFSLIFPLVMRAEVVCHLLVDAVKSIYFSSYYAAN